MPRTLPPRPDLDWLKNRAKERLAELRRHDPAARLTMAQLEVAREYGLASWRQLKKVVEAVRERTPEQLADDVAAAFLRAAGTGDVARLEAMLAAAPQLVHVVGPHPFWGGRPQALHVAIEADRRDVFDRLLAAGADVDGRNDGYSHWSPLLVAVQRGHRAMRDELLRRGATVGPAEALALGDDERLDAILAADPAALDRPVPNGGSWLAFARTTHAVDRLLERGVPVDQADAFGTRPVEALSRLGEAGAPLVRRLVAAGAKASASEHARLGDRARLQALAAEDPAAVRAPAVLVAAVDGGHHDLAAWLLAQGADPSARAAGQSRQTALHVAAWNGDLEMARLLVEHGADPQALDEEHRATPAGWAETAVTVANRPRCREVAAYLRSLGGAPPAAPEPPPARPSVAKRRAPWKPLMDAAFTGDATRVERLLEEGADPNVRSPTRHHHRPLHRAIETKKTLPKHRGHEAVVRILLEHGADPRLRGGIEELTALQLAAVGEPRFVPIVLPHLEPLDIFDASVTLREERVAELLANDRALAGATDVNGWTALHYVAASALFRSNGEARAAQLRIARALLDHGADVAATYRFENEWPIPVLYQCCGRHDNPALARLLLDAGAAPCDGESLFHAAENLHRGALGVFAVALDPETLARECTGILRTLIGWRRVRGATWLLEHGADPNALDPKTGDSALHTALRHRGGARLLKLLLHHGARPEAPNRAGETAIELARRSGDGALLKLLGGSG